MARMSTFAGRLGLAFLLAAFCLAGRMAHAQSAPVSYWIPGWPLGFGGNPTTSQSSNTYGNFPSFEGTDARGVGFSRYNFQNGFFVGSERGSIGFSRDPAFGSLYSEGMQFGYNFQNAPVTLFGGFDTLKYNTGFGAPLAPFSSMSGTAGYGAHAGVEFKPASNLSVSLGFSYSQTGGRIDSDTPSPSLSNTSQFDLVGGRH
jgi:opacity protein-like surface antigen